MSTEISREAAHRLLSPEELLGLSGSERIAYFLFRAYLATEYPAAIAEALQAIGWAYWQFIRDDEEIAKRRESHET